MHRLARTARIGAAALLLVAGACRDTAVVRGCPASYVIESVADWNALLQGSCREIDGDLYVTARGVPALPGVFPFTRVGGRLVVTETDRLTQLRLPQLASVGSLEVSGNAALTVLDLPALTSVAEDLVVLRNAVLPALHLPSLRAVTGAVTISANPFWPECDVLDFAASLGRDRSDPALAGNGPWRYGPGLCAPLAPPPPPDAGPPDSGPPDSGPFDAGPPDAGPFDAGLPDAGPPPHAPTIEFTSVPALGSKEPLLGLVRYVDPAAYRVAIYIQVNGGWWTKPYWDHALTLIAADGTFNCNVTTGGIDEQAQAMAGYLLPAGIDPPLLSGQGSLPGLLDQGAVASTSVQR